MILSKFAHFLLQKRMHAISVVLALCLWPTFLVKISMIIVSFITLRRGPREGAILLFWGILPFFAHAYVQDSWLLLVYAILEFGMMWLLAVVLRLTHAWSTVLQGAALLGVIAIGVLHISFNNLRAMWENIILQFMQQHYVVGENAANKETIFTFAKWLSQFATGFEVSIFLSAVLLKLLVARWWQSIVFNPGALQSELHHIRLSKWLFGLFVAMLVIGLLGVTQTLDTLPPMLLVFFAAGLSLLHCYMKGRKYAIFLLGLVYISFGVFFPYLTMFPVVFAMADACVNLRNRFVQLR